jgi:acetyltransferase-like isoleucine patch superfamily enzyme
MRKINDLFFRIYYRILCVATWLVTWIKFKVNGVIIKGDFIARGTPIMRVSLGGRMLVGRNFQMNSGALHNSIGRPQRCSFVIGDGACLSIGDNVGISSTAIVCRLRIDIESDVRIGGGVVIYDTNFHSLKVGERTSLPEVKDHVQHKAIVIKKGAFIGGHSMILKGVVIGENSIVGAGSVVSKSIPPNEIWAGNPAKFIKSL